MPPNISDAVILLNQQDQWKIRAKLLMSYGHGCRHFWKIFHKNNSEFSQPIELRFNELISGVRSDVGIKVFGDDMEVLNTQAQAIAQKVQKISGATAVKVEQN